MRAHASKLTFDEFSEPTVETSADMRFAVLHFFGAAFRKNDSFSFDDTHHEKFGGAFTD